MEWGIPIRETSQSYTRNFARAQLCVRLECDKITCCKSNLETMQLVLIDALDYETKQKLNQPLDFEQVALPRVCFL